MYSHGNPNQLNSPVESGQDQLVCAIASQLDFMLHSSLIPDSVAGLNPSNDSTVELDWEMWHGIKECNQYVSRRH